MLQPRHITAIHLTRCQAGMSLLNVIMLLMLIGVLVTVGAALVGPLVKRGKITDTKTTLSSNADAIMHSAAVNGRLPNNTTFAAVAVNRFDAWGKDIRYLYDANLALTSADSLCRAPATNLTVNSTSNVAFALYSFGDDFSSESTWTGSPALSDATVYYPTSSAVTATLASSDIYRIVTLAELQSRANCSNFSGNRLRIINNELPKACNGAAYSATIYAEGGVPFTTNQYQWSIANLPTGVTTTPTAIYPNWSPASATLQLSGTAAFGTPTIYLRDNQSPQTVVQRSFEIKQAANCTSLNDFVGPASNKVQFAFDPTTGTYTISTTKGTDTGCRWYNVAQSIPAGKIFRIYFEFIMDEETSISSSDYGNGFAFALFNSTAGLPISTCGWSPLGYEGIAADTIALEFDSYKDSTNDPISGGGTRNHLALQVNNSDHAAGQCSVLPQTLPPSCGYQTGSNLDAVRWFENGTLTGKHKIRIDIEQATGLVKVWLDCADCTNPGSPTIQRIVAVPPSFYYGFTTASQGNRNQSIQISNFSAGYY